MSSVEEKTLVTVPVHNVSISLRDYFAGQALQGLVARQEFGGFNQWDVARDAYKLADAMLEMRTPS